MKPAIRAGAVRGAMPRVQVTAGWYQLGGIDHEPPRRHLVFIPISIALGGRGIEVAAPSVKGRIVLIGLAHLPQGDTQRRAAEPRAQRGD